MKFGIPVIPPRGHPRGKNGGIPEGSCLFFMFSAILIENIKHFGIRNSWYPPDGGTRGARMVKFRREVVFFFMFSAISIENIKHLQNQTQADVCPGGPE